MFGLEFISEPGSGFGEPAIRGRITLGEFSEEFIAPLVFWSPDDYRRQWAEAAERIVGGYDRTCFVQAMRESPRHGPMLLWAAYKSGDLVHVQQKLLLEQTLNAEFDPANLYEQVNERETVDEECRAISEWVISVTEIALFLRRAG